MQILKIRCKDSIVKDSPFYTFLERLPSTFNQQGRIVHNARNQLRIMDVSGYGLPTLSAVMVKRYHGLFLFQRVWYTFFRSPKCRRAYDNTVELRRRGLPAVEELACVEVWTHGLFKYGFFISKVGEGERMDNLVISMQKQENQREIQAIIQQFAILLKQLHENGVLYMDMNCGNVLCEKDSSTNGWNFCLIDTNRVKLFDEHQVLDIETAMPDIILMNPRMGTVELFIETYLRVRNLFSPKEAARIRHIQRERHEKPRRLKQLLQPFKNKYYRWLAK